MKFIPLSLIIIVFFSTNCLSGELWTDTNYNNQNYIFSLEVFGNSLFAATGTNNPSLSSAKIMVLENGLWKENYRISTSAFLELYKYNDELYSTSSTGNIIKTKDAKEWSDDFFAKGNVYSMQEYKENLYAGDNIEEGYARLLKKEDNTWKYLPLEIKDESIWDMEVHDNKLYIATGNGPLLEKGNIYFYDGEIIKNIYSDENHDILSLGSYKGKLYAGLSNDGVIMSYDGKNWVVEYDSTEDSVNVLKIFEDKLYAGTSDGGYLLIYDGNSWNEEDISNSVSVQDLVVFNDKLYAGMAGIGEIMYQKIGEDYAVPELSSAGIIFIILIVFLSLGFFRKKYGH